MKRLILASALASGLMIGLETPSFAHGGTYRGPGDTVPPGGGGGGGGGPTTPGPSGPSSPGPSGPSSPGPAGPGSPGGGAPIGGGAPAKPLSGGGGGGGPDLTAWSFWWEFNKDPYLNLKAHVHSGGVTTGSDGWFLGMGAKKQARDSLRPSEEQIRQKVVPALLKALESESNNDIVTGCMIALAKIGDVKDEAGASKFEQTVLPFLKDSNQEIAETSAVALGILANDAAIDKLAALLKDGQVGDANGRDLVGGGEVQYRTRSFAAYGLALVGSRTADEERRRSIVRHLTDVIGGGDFSTRDIKVACVIALGLVPVQPFEPESGAGDGDTVPAYVARTAQIDFLLGFLEDPENHYLIRAHAPTALARLSADLPDGLAETYKDRIAESLLSRIARSSKEKREVQQSCILALGQLGDSDKGKTDVAIRKALMSVPKDLSDQQSRLFAMIALAKIGGAMGDGDDAVKGMEAVGKELMRQLSKGKSSVQPWAGISIGVMGRLLTDANVSYGASMSAALRSALADEKASAKVGAYAIGTGILGDIEATEVLLNKLDRIRDDEARGYVAVSLGLMNAREGIEPIQKIVKESKYRPDLLKQAAIGLGLLGDKELVPELVDMLTGAKGLATQAAPSSALGFIGDSRSIDPLVSMLEDKSLTDSARGFAAVALGIVADKEPLPWNSKIGVDLNYRASTQTLNDQSGTGILNIL